MFNKGIYQPIREDDFLHLSLNKRLWFARYFSTGAGKDSWPRNSNIFKNFIDYYFDRGTRYGADRLAIDSAAVRHDWQYSLGFESEAQRQQVDIEFCIHAKKLGAPSWLVEMAYKLIRLYGGYEIRKIRRDQNYLDYLIKYQAEFYEKTGYRLGVLFLREKLKEKDAFNAK